MSKLLGQIDLVARDHLRDWVKSQPLAEITKSSYVQGRLEKWYGIGSNLRSIKANTAALFVADKPWQRLIDFGNRLIPDWNSILICGGPTSIGWHRDHGHFENEAIMINLGAALFSELPRNFDIGGAKTATKETGLTELELNDGAIIALDIKNPHKAEQRSDIRFHITFRIIKPLFIDAAGFGSAANPTPASTGNVSSQIRGMNIYSRSSDGKGLAAALTNPTTLSRKHGSIQRDYPISLYGKTFNDAEDAYHALCKQVGPKCEADEDKLMIEVIALKFKQYPILYDTVHKLGGSEFLATCRHYTYARTERYQSWEGAGLESRMIRNLVKGFEMARHEKLNRLFPSKDTSNKGQNHSRNEGSDHG